MRTKLDELDELAVVIMMLLGVLFIAAIFGNNNEYRQDLRARVLEARESVWQANERSNNGN